MKLKTMLLLESKLAVPSSPYLDAYADMRPAQAFTFDQALGGATSEAAQDILPAFALSETGISSRSAMSTNGKQVLRSTSELSHALSNLSELSKRGGRTLPPTLITAAKARVAADLSVQAGAKSSARTQSLSSTRRTIHLGEKFRRGGNDAAAQDGTAALAARDPREAEREAAVQRLTVKHASLQARMLGQRRSPCLSPCRCRYCRGLNSETRITYGVLTFELSSQPPRIAHCLTCGKTPSQSFPYSPITYPLNLISFAPPSLRTPPLPPSSRTKANRLRILFHRIRAHSTHKLIPSQLAGY